MSTKAVSLHPGSSIAMLYARIGLLFFVLIAAPRQNFHPAPKWLGVWKMNPAKSTLDPGTPPPRRTQKLEEVSEGLKITDDRIDFHGNESKLEYTLPLDAKAVPFPDIAGATVLLDRPDETGFYVILKIINEEMIATVVSRYAFSEDGKTMTFSQLTTQRKREPNAPEKQSSVRLVFDKQP